MATTVRAGAGAASTPTKGRRHSVVLSDGNAVMVLVNPANNNLLVYLSDALDRAGWTLKNTLTATNQTARFSVAIDSANNLHIVQVVGTGSSFGLVYHKLTFSAGPLWTPTAAATVQSNSTNHAHHDGPDISVDPAGTVVAVTWMTDTSTTANSPELRTYFRHSGGVWVASTAATLAGAGNPQPLGSVIALDAAGVSGGQITALILYAFKDTASGFVLTKRIFNSTTGAVVSTTPIDSAFLGGAAANTSWNAMGLWSTAAGVWRGLALTGTRVNWAFQASATAVTKIESSTGVAYTLATSRDVAMLQDRGVFFTRSGQGTIVARTVNFEGATITFGSEYTFYTHTSAGAIEAYAGGTNMNFSAKKVDVGFFVPGTGAYLHHYNVAPVAPASGSVEPVQGATVTSDTPQLRLTRGANASSNPKTYGRWKVATDAAMSSNLRTVTSTTAAWTGLASANVPDVDKLYQTTWYIKGYVVDEYGVESAAAVAVDDDGVTIANQTFLVYHPPASTDHTPTGGVYTAYGTGDVTFSWKMTDPSPTDEQTAYQVVIKNSSTGTIVHDTGKVVSTSESVTINLAAGQKDVPLIWELTLWDSSDVPSAVVPQNAFSVADPLTVTITSPAEGGVANNPQPTVTWTAPAIADRSQAQRRVIFRLDGVAIHNSTWEPSTSMSYTPSEPVLEEGLAYTVDVYIRDNKQLEDSDTNAFTTVWTPPTAPDFIVNEIPYDQFGYIEITWTNADKDADFYLWRVYRRRTGGGDRVILYETAEDIASYSYKDYMAESGQGYEYSVVQVADRFGSLVESTRVWDSVTATSESYWLIDPTDETYNTQLKIVTADSYTTEYEEEIVHVLGRGRHRDTGDRIGVSGSLTAQLYDTAGGPTARERKQQLETLRERGIDLYLRNPFGDVVKVSIGAPQIERMAGVGNREFVTVQLEYLEMAP